ncbi:MAG: peptidyl-prolyl cis-trans isomerase, partial [Terriglobia bacterium]
QMGTQSPSFRSLILDQLIRDLITRQAMTYEAQRLGLQVTPEELAARLRGFSWVYPGGEFVGMDVYRQLVQQQFRMSVPQFEEELRQQLLQAKLLQWVTVGVTVAPAEVEQEYRRQNETVQVGYVLFRPQEYARRLQPDPEAVRAYFEAHQEQYVMPERRAVRFVAVDYDTLGRRVPVSREELEDYYQRHQQDFHLAERAKIRRILLLHSEAEEGEEALRQQASEFLQQLRAGRDFAQLARQHSDDPTSREEGGEVGWVGRGQTVPELEQVLFSLSPGDPAVLVETSYGFEIVQVLDYQPEHVRSLKEVQEEIEPIVKVEKVRRLAREQAGRIVAAVRAGQSLEQAAQAQGWGVRDSALFERNEAVASFAPDSGFQEAAFRLAADSAGQPDAPVSEPVSVPPGYAVLQLKEVQPAHPATFEEVRGRVLAAFREEHGREQAREAAHELAAQAAEQGGLSRPARQMGLEVKTTEPFGRDEFLPDLGAARDVAPVAFNLEPGEVSPALPLGENWVVFQVVEHTEADLSRLTPEERQALHDSLLEQKRLLVWSIFQESLKKRLRAEGKLEVNQAAIDRLVGSG